MLVNVSSAASVVGCPCLRCHDNPTAGALHPYVELNVKQRIDSGLMPGAEMFLTGPFLNGQGSRLPDEMVVRGPEEARRAVRYCAAKGFTSMKAYTYSQSTR